MHTLTSLPSRQRGLGWFGLLFVLGALGFAAIVVVKAAPLYLNQMKLARAVQRIVDDPENARAGAAEIHRSLQRSWDIDDIKHIEPREVKVARTPRGRVLRYDYEARVHLFYNISMVIEFRDEKPLAASSSADAEG